MKKRLKALIVAAMVVLMGAATLTATGCEGAGESPAFERSDEWTTFY